MKSPTKPRTAGVRKGYCGTSTSGELNPYFYNDTKEVGYPGGRTELTIPVAVVDLRPASMEALVEVAHKALQISYVVGETDLESYARTMLAAVFKTRGMGK